MIPLESKLTGREGTFADFQEYFGQHQFTLGGNWEYDHGFFDKALDEENKVWVRIPFETLVGEVEGETSASDAKIRIGQPFVLRHEYNEGLDGEAQFRAYGGLIDQFQEPSDKDARVDGHYEQEGRSVLEKMEKELNL